MSHTEESTPRVAPHRTVSRPFSGRIEGTTLTRPTADATIYTGGATASGHGTHIGAFSKVTDDVINLAKGLVTGSFTMTGAGGEQLSGQYEGPVAVDLFAGTLSWRLDATITGGTGRFARAAGEFVFVASGRFVISPDGSVSTRYTETFEGTIEF